jgi:hypothetical protein
MRVGYRTGRETWTGWTFGAGYELRIARFLVLGMDMVYRFSNLPRGTRQVSAYLKVEPSLFH